MSSLELLYHGFFPFWYLSLMSFLPGVHGASPISSLFRIQCCRTVTKNRIVPESSAYLVGGEGDNRQCCVVASNWGKLRVIVALVPVTPFSPPIGLLLSDFHEPTVPIWCKTESVDNNCHSLCVTLSILTSYSSRPVGNWSTDVHNWPQCLLHTH